MKAIDRPTLIAALRGALQRHVDVDAAWEGGSAAFEALDEFSDVDAVAVVADERLDEVFTAIETALGAVSPIALRCDMPAAPGYRQRFYRLHGCPEFLVVDLVLIRRSDPLLFREVELHGRGLTWFDRRGLLQEMHLDAVADQEAARQRIPVLRDAFAMFQHIPTKERLRGRAVEALQFYLAMALRPLVEALRLWHCPQRRGFGLRYLARDLPADVVQRIEALSFVRDLDDMAVKHAQAQQWFDETMADLLRAGPGGADAIGGPGSSP